MSEARHTPGPWAVSDERECGTRHFASILSFNPEVRGYEVAICRAQKKFIGEGLANAFLIAAAPRLLQELRHLVGFLEPLELSGGMNVPGLATLNGARAAIAIAEGRQ